VVSTAATGRITSRHDVKFDSTTDCPHHYRGNMKSSEVVLGLAALAHDSRLAVFRLLVKRGPVGFTPSQLADKLAVSAPTLSFHLKELQHAGLIEVRRNGRHLYYRPNFSRMKRFHLHISVEDLDESIRFYTTLFAAQPTVRQPDYATTTGRCT
jgi:ArsR family transcriptional regulator